MSLPSFPRAILRNLSFGSHALIAASLATAPASLRAQAAPQPAGWAHIRTAVLFTSDDVAKLLATTEERQATVAYFAPLRMTKVYLENASIDPSAAPALRAIADDLKARGLQVSGVLVPSSRGGPLCYNDPKDMELLEARTRVLAQVFDEIILDDWLFTTCTTAKSLEERGSQSWADYRSRLVAEQSKRHIIDVAKAVNLRVQVIIKYPNWYEGHRQNGYDVALQTPQFDGVSVGIETRQMTTQDQHIPTYSGYVFQRWIGGNAGAKWRSAWLDNFQMAGDFDEFAAEVWQAVLARAPEIIFWCAGELHPPRPDSDLFAPLAAMMPEFDRLAGMLDGPARGIPIHLPLGSVGEYNIFGYLGMAGLPMDPRSDFPADTKTAIFTQHSLRDPALADELLARVRSGREIFLTWALLQDLRRSELWQAFNVIGERGTVTSSTFRVREAQWRATPVDAARPFTFPKIQLSIWPYVRQVALVREDDDFGVLLTTPYLEGKVDVLAMPDNSHDLLVLPDPVLNALRSLFFDTLGVRLVGRGGVALYPFGDRQYVLYNMNREAAKVALRLPAGTPTLGWQERMHGSALMTGEIEKNFRGVTLKETEVALTLQPFEIVLVERP
jgi:hypothetical protein